MNKAAQCLASGSFRQTLISIIVGTLVQHCMAEARDVYVVGTEIRQGMSRHLIVGAAELPTEAVLRSFGITASGYWANWARVAQHGKSPTPGASVKFSAGFCDSVEQALESARMKLRSVAVRIPDVSGEASEYGNLGDRVWHSGGRIVFVKGTALVDVYAGVSGDAGQGEQIALHVAKLLSRKIDAVVAGKAEPVPVLPFLSHVRKEGEGTTEEQGLEWAWAVKKLHESWGEQGTTLVFVDRNGLPRSIPAKKVGENDYLVPLQFATRLIDPTSRIDPHLAGATIHGEPPNYSEVHILGKTMRITWGQAAVTVDGKPVPLDRAPERAVGSPDISIPLVPLSSFAEKALGVKVEFSKHGDLPKITLTPGGALGK